MRAFLALLFFSASLSTIFAGKGTISDSEIAANTLIRVGDAVPDFSCQMTDSRAFTLSHQKGKIVLLYFFSPSTPFAYPQMRYIEKEIVEKLAKRDDFTVLCLGSGHTREELVRIGGENKLTLPMAADEKKEISSKIFTRFLPRTVLIGKDGRVVYMNTGSKEIEGILLLQEAISKELGR
jgi:peroxiredoxin